MKRTRSWIRKTGDKEEDKDRRISLRKKNKIRYTDDDDSEEEDGEEEEESEDQQDNELLDQANHNKWAQEKRLPVTCGDKMGFLDVKRLNRGEECIWCEGCWFSPPAFEDLGGKGSSKKWKATIFHEDKPLQIFFEKGILTTKGFKRRGSKIIKAKKNPSSNLESETSSEERETDVIISATVKKALQTVKIVIERLQQSKYDRQSKCNDNQEQGQRNDSITDDPSFPAATHSDSAQLFNSPPIVLGTKEENGEEFTQSDEKKHGQTEIKTYTGNLLGPLSAPVTSSPNIKPDIADKTEDTGSFSDHTANLSTSPALLGDRKVDLEEKDDGELETEKCVKREKEWKRKEHLDMSRSEASILPFATGNIRDVTSDTVITLGDFKDKNPSTTPRSAMIQCKYDNLEHRDGTTCSDDAVQSQVMKPDTRGSRTSQSSDSTHCSNMEEGLSSRPSASINLDMMDLAQLKKEKTKLQLKVLKLQEEYYTLKIKEFKKCNCFDGD